MKRQLFRLFRVAAWVSVGACAGAADGPSDDEDQDDAALSAGSLPVVLGEWSGHATVKAGRLLAAGRFPARLHVAQFGRSVRGILEITERPEDPLATSFAYRFDGSVSGNKVHLFMADRVCGAVKPEGLCDAGPPRPAFASDGLLANGKLTFAKSTVMDGVKFPRGVPAEPPFEALELAPKKPAHNSSVSSFVGRWAGECSLPDSLFLPSPLPLFGGDEVTLANTDGGLTISGFKNNRKSLPVGTDASSIIASQTFRVDQRTKRFWFVQRGGNPGWLYVGRKTGDSLSGVVTFAGAFVAGAPPIDPMTIPLEQIVGVFNFAHQP